MALAISTNFAINANTALNAMNKSQSLMGKSISRISTGNRAANPADDPLSYFSGNKIKGDTDGYQALYNGIQDGAARINVADTALSSIIDVLTEMKSKAIAYESLNSTDQAGDAGTAISNAYNQLYSSLSSFTGATYKGVSVWDSSGLSFTTTLGATADSSSTSGTGGTSGSSGSTVNLPSSVDTSSQKYVTTDGSAKLHIGSTEYTLETVTTAGQGASGTYSTNNTLTDYTGIVKNSSSQEVGRYKLSGSTYSFEEVDGGSLGLPSTLDTSTQTYVDVSANKLYVGSTEYSINTTAPTGTYSGNMSTVTGQVLSGSTEVGRYSLSGNVYTFEALSSSSSSSSTGSTGSGSTLTVSNIGQPDVSSVSAISAGSSTIQGVIDTISKQRTSLGGSLAAMDSISSYLSSMTTANEAAYTAVTEANIAKEMTSYVKNNVYSQAAQAMISQANQSLAQVLNLLQ